MLDVKKIREDFPALSERINDCPLVYFDNAATTHRPQVVIDAVDEFYLHKNANVHRGIHTLSERATLAYEKARAAVKTFINAKEDRECIFVRGTTEAINLIAHSYGVGNLNAGDEIIITTMEHHSNIVPWQQLCQQTGAVIRELTIHPTGELDLEQYSELLNERTKIVALAHISNALGTINPVKKMTEMAHKVGAIVVVDGAQSAPRIPVDMQDLDCDFFAFSGHKLFAPTGIGVLYGKASLLEKMPPYQTGGGMIRTVAIENSTFTHIPERFEAGTPHIAGVIGLHAAIDYITALGMENIASYEDELTKYTDSKLSAVPEVNLIGKAKERTSVFSFVLDHIHAHDVGTILDNRGIAVRSGHHCAMPLMKYYNVVSTVRASLTFYNTMEEVDYFVEALSKVHEVFD